MRYARSAAAGAAAAAGARGRKLWFADTTPEHTGPGGDATYSMDLGMDYEKQLPLTIIFHAYRMSHK